MLTPGGPAHPIGCWV
uniref:Uncharacterized protein n=1 Tax=Anguilla anguilla TaxID=7936 RepID=A0A0E9UNM2_ANGAN